MAKASKKHSSVEDIFKELSEINPFGSSNFGESEVHQNKTFIPTWPKYKLDRRSLR